MVRILDYEVDLSGPVNEVIQELPKDPEGAGFRRVSESSGILDYELDVGMCTLRVRCEVKTVDGRRWLCLGVSKYPNHAGLHDLSFVRRSFLGGDTAALILFEPDLPPTPLGDTRLNLWMPLDEAILPTGHYKKVTAY